MKLRKHFFIAATVAASLSTVYCTRADDDTTTTTTMTTTTTEDQDDHDHDTWNHPSLYRDQEVNVDLFGSGSFGVRGNRSRSRTFYGGGGGLTVFFLRYVGVGGEYDAEARPSRFMDRASGNVFLRYPIRCCPGLALSPYIFGGGGYEFQEVRQAFGQAGGGIEFRFTKNVGIFADGRCVFANRTRNFAQVRAGLRISF